MAALVAHRFKLVISASYSVCEKAAKMEMAKCLDHIAIL
jgi:hypothetical protein